MPAAAARAMRLVRDPDTTTDELAKVVLIDPALAARVLTMSRSVLYLRRTPPKSLREAIVTVGFQGLRRILMAASARSAFSADELAKETPDGGAPAGDAFIAGLLHDIGKLIFHVADPKAYAQLGVCDSAREREFFGATHDLAGACVAEIWGLDDAVVQAILGHHGGETPTPLAVLVGRADLIATEIGYGSVPQGAVPGLAVGESPELAERVRTLFESEKSLFD
jgi:HD-like signal output (HDOD) protein